MIAKEHKRARVELEAKNVFGLCASDRTGRMSIKRERASSKAQENAIRKHSEQTRSIWTQNPEDSGTRPRFTERKTRRLSKAPQQRTGSLTPQVGEHSGTSVLHMSTRRTRMHGRRFDCGVSWGEESSGRNSGLSVKELVECFAMEGARKNERKRMNAWSKESPTAEMGGQKTAIKKR